MTITALSTLIVLIRVKSNFVSSLRVFEIVKKWINTCTLCVQIVWKKKKIKLDSFWGQFESKHFLLNWLKLFELALCYDHFFYCVLIQNLASQSRNLLIKSGHFVVLASSVERWGSIIDSLWKMKYILLYWSW